jgi:hypothetical protein
VENPDFFVHLAWGYGKGVLRLAVSVYSFFGPDVRRQSVPVFEGHRLPSTGSLWDIRWVRCRGKTWFLCM